MSVFQLKTVFFNIVLKTDDMKYDSTLIRISTLGTWDELYCIRKFLSVSAML